MIEDVRWRACHLQAKATPALDILDRKSVHGSRAILQCKSGRISTRLTSSADPAFATSAG